MLAASACVVTAVLQKNTAIAHSFTRLRNGFTPIKGGTEPGNVLHEPCDQASRNVPLAIAQCGHVSLSLLVPSLNATIIEFA
jgi:hypothetical protein